jgi:hypothetical protein
MSSYDAAVLCGVGMLAFFMFVLWLNGDDGGD